MYEAYDFDTHSFSLNSPEIDAMPDDPKPEGPEIMNWKCGKGHTWQTFGEVSFMTYIDPINSEEITTGPICVKCYFKHISDNFVATKKEDNHGFRVN